MGLIKKYETGELIGSGAMGSVYRARDIVLERDVALKVLHTRDDADPEMKERFYREARLGANLRHPNIVIVYELDEFNGVPFMAMELLNGADMRHYIKERVPLSLAQKVEIFAQICDGLAAAHKRGIVHRDIKPSNIFLDEDKLAKILDFGIARPASSKLTIAGKVLGTPNYMAPEQINRKPCDARSDIFSTAIVFYEFLVYAHPFHSTFIPRRIVEEDPDTLFEKDPLIPESLAKLLYSALEKRPENRIQTAEEFGAGMRAVLQELRTGLAAQPMVHSAAPVAINVDPSPGSDSSENSPDGRLAIFVQLLSDFERADQTSNLDDASRIVQEMTRLEATDNRFTDALRECTGKLERIRQRIDPAYVAADEALASAATIVGGTMAHTAAHAPGTLPPAGSKEQGNAASASHDVLNQTTGEARDAVCPSCNAPNRRSAAFCLNCGAQMQAAQEPVLTASARADASSSGSRSGELSGSGSQLASPKPSLGERLRSLAAPFFALPRNTQYMIWGALGVILTSAVVIAAIVSHKPVPVQAALGRAEVQSERVALLEGADPSSKVLEEFGRGTRLNVLGHIVDGTQRYAHVQFVSSDKNSQPGFVPVADLAGWSSDDAAVAWEYVGLQRPASGADSQQLRKFIDVLENHAVKFPQTDSAKQAQVEQAGIYIGLAEQASAGGAAQTEWQADIDKAKQALDAAGAGEAGAAPNQQLLARVAALTPAAEEEPLEAKDRSTVLAEAALKNAARAWHEGNYDECDLFANKAIELAGKNEKLKRDANWWLGKSRESRKRLLQ